MQNESGVVQSLDNSLQRQLSIDLSSFSSPSDLVDKLQMFNVDLVEFARENVGLFLAVCIQSCSIIIIMMKKALGEDANTVRWL